MDEHLEDILHEASIEEPLLYNGRWYVTKDAALAGMTVIAVRHDEQMERLKACEHIADGDDGWPALRDLCPSTAAVARLKDRAASYNEMLGAARAGLEDVANRAYLRLANTEINF